MKYLSFFFLFCLCSITLISEAQISDWQHLSGSHKVNSIAHDGNIIWFATQEYGVGKYDRTRNHTTYFNMDNSPIPTNSIHQVYMTPKGQLWAQGNYEWFVFDGQNWMVFDENNSPLTSQFPQYDIAASKDGKVWLSNRKKVFQFDGANWKVVAVPAHITNVFTSQITVDSEDNLWLNSPQSLLKYDGNEWREFEYPSEDLLNYSWISDMKVDGNQNVWMSLSGYYPVEFQTGGLAKFDGEEWTVYTALETGLSLNSYFLTIDKEDKVWVTSNSNTIVGFDGQGFESYSTIISNASMNPSAVAIDANNEVWVGTNRGLERLEGGEFEEVKIVFPEPWLLQGLAVRGGLEASDIWFRGLNGLVKFDGTNWTFVPFENEFEVFKEGFGSVIPTTDGSLWSISQDKTFECVNGECVVHEPFEIEAQHGRVNDGVEDREGNIWFLIDRRQRLIHYDGTEWTDFTESMQAAHLNIQYGTTIYGITFDHDNHLWLGTSKGKLHEWDGEKWETFDLRVPQDFSHQPIHDIAVDKNNQIWVAHQASLKLFDGEQVIERFTSTDLGFHETNFWNLNIDSRNNDLWVGTSKAGLLHFNGTDWTNYTSENSPLTYNSIDFVLIDPTGHKWIVPQYGGYDIFREGGTVPLMTTLIDPEDEEDETHPDYTIGENIPNPFIESTRILIDLTESSWVKINVFDNMGQLITSFQNEQMLAGKHYFDLDATDLKPNLYYYTLETKNGKINGKMLKQ
ncbi:MAG: T9SS type A sorting domain-containing protein [Chitinophagales bacterium]